jgi:hypothetical protein
MILKAFRLTNQHNLFCAQSILPVIFVSPIRGDRDFSVLISLEERLGFCIELTKRTEGADVTYG